MQPATFETATYPSRDGPVIALRGEIDGDAKDALAAAYDSVPRDGRLLLDFTDVSYINSTGIALIVALLARARAANQPVAGTGLSDHYQEIFEITRITDFMTILTPTSRQHDD